MTKHQALHDLADRIIRVTRTGGGVKHANPAHIRTLHVAAAGLIGQAVGAVLAAAIAAVQAGQAEAEMEPIAAELDRIDSRLATLADLLEGGGSALMLGPVSGAALAWEALTLVRLTELLDALGAELPAAEAGEAA
jgi:hypothetical protein